MIVKTPFLVSLWLIVTSTTGFSQSVPITVLSEPEATFSRGFTNIAGVRELSDGRVVVVDAFEMTAVLLNAAWSVAKELGRRGEGPGEYVGPSQVFAIPGDSSAIFDEPNRRLLVITPEGKPGEFLYPPGDRTCGPPPAGRLGVVQATDGQGHFYARAEPIAISVTGTREVADSAAIERWTAGSCRRDTLGFVPNPLGPRSFVVGRAVVGQPGSIGPFRPSVQWGVARDGRLAIVFPEPFHVAFVEADGQRRRGPDIRFDPIRVSEDHKEKWREVQRRPRVVSVLARGQATTTRQVLSLPAREPASWPRYLPPFLSGAVSFAFDGSLWVHRTTPAGEPPTFDVLDETGVVVDRVKLPMDTRLVGFGDGTVYLVRRDELDLEYLERYRLLTDRRQGQSGAFRDSATKAKSRSSINAAADRSATPQAATSGKRRSFHSRCVPLRAGLFGLDNAAGR